MSFLLKCPNCGERSVYEFRFGGEIRKRPGPEAGYEDFLNYALYKRNVAESRPNGDDYRHTY